MEAAVAAGYVETVADVADFCRGRLQTAGRVGAAFAATSCRSWQSGMDADGWRTLDAEFSARTPSEITRAASRNLGNGLRRLLRATVAEHREAMTQRWSRCPSPAPHHPLVLGAGVAMAGGGPVMAARAAALGVCTTPASAAVRLLGLDPYATHNVVALLCEQVDQIAAQSSVARAFDDLPSASAPALELLADVHARMEVRLFAS